MDWAFVIASEAIQRREGGVWGAAADAQFLQIFSRRLKRFFTSAL
jgi:hypothetical protein